MTTVNVTDKITHLDQNLDWLPTHLNVAINVVNKCKNRISENGISRVMQQISKIWSNLNIAECLNSQLYFHGATTTAQQLEHIGFYLDYLSKQSLSYEKRTTHRKQLEKEITFVYQQARYLHPININPLPLIQKDVTLDELNMSARRQVRSAPLLALNDLSEVFLRCPSNLTALNTCGFAFLLLGDTQHAMRDAVQVLQSSPSLDEEIYALKTCAFTFFHLQNFESTEEVLQRIFTKSPHDSTCIYMSAYIHVLSYLNNCNATLVTTKCYLSPGQVNDAIADSAAVLLRNPDDPLPYRLLALAYLQKNDPLKSLQYISCALSIVPQDVDTQAILAKVLCELKDYQHASNIIVPLLQANPENLLVKIIFEETEKGLKPE